MKKISISEVANADFKGAKKPVGLTENLRKLLPTLAVGEGVSVAKSETTSKRGPVFALNYLTYNEKQSGNKEFIGRKFSVRERRQGGWVVVRTK